MLTPTPAVMVSMKLFSLDHVLMSAVVAEKVTMLWKYFANLNKATYEGMAVMSAGEAGKKETLLGTLKEHFWTLSTY